MGGSITAVCFLAPPKAYFTRESIILTTPKEKRRLLKAAGVNAVRFLDFAAIKDLSAKQFVDRLIKEFNPTAVVCGENYTFGKGGKGDTDLLCSLLNTYGVRFMAVPILSDEQGAVSSSRIRAELLAGNIKSANKLLGRSFSISGRVVTGDMRGRTIGYPTANMRYPKGVCNVKAGVYSCDVLLDGKTYKGITNIGVRPTYRCRFIGAETFVFGFAGDIYGKNITLELNAFLREEKKFNSLEELKAAIEKDCQMAK